MITKYIISIGETSTAMNITNNNETIITKILNDRKNASFKRIIKEINDDFLLEYICSITGIDDKGLCGGYGGKGALCPIKNVMKYMKLKKIK